MGWTTFDPVLAEPVGTDGSVTLHITGAEIGRKDALTADLQAWRADEMLHADRVKLHLDDERQKFAAKASVPLPINYQRLISDAVFRATTALYERLKAPPTPADDDGSNTGDAAVDSERDNPYVLMATGFYWLKTSQDGPPVRVPLTNFTAKIVADRAEDDGVDVRRSFLIEAALRGRTVQFHVPAERFAAMNWPTEHLGPTAIVYAGFGKKDHARAAIQLYSENIVESRIYAHLGWRRIADQWIYLHAGGGIGKDGPVAGVEVSLSGPLARFRLPDPPTGDDLIAAIRASLRILALARQSITVPVLAAVYRAPLRVSDFTEHLAGPTHASKSELAALAQQHYGPEMNARNLPGGWESTANSLEGLAFLAKDALFVVDDFAPSGSMTDVQRLHRYADRLLRAQGNGTGRARMRSDATIKAPKPPRGLIQSTGEDVPRGKSLRGRMLILEVGPKDLDFIALTACQADAAAGLYAQAMAGYVCWLGGRRDDLDAGYRDELAELRAAAARSDLHRRTPEIVANLAIGWRCFLRFGLDAGALTPAEAADLWQAGWDALGDAAKAQARHQEASEPTRRFLELLSAAISSGAAHLAGVETDRPGAPKAWGWCAYTVRDGEDTITEWRPLGRRVGWVDDDDLYLDRDAALAEVQRLGRDTGDGLTITGSTLAKRLHERGMLASTDQARETLTVRRTLDGKRRDVLHMRAQTFSHTPEISHVGKPDQPDQSDETASDDGAGSAEYPTIGRVPWSGFATNPTSTNGVQTPQKGALVGLVGFSRETTDTCVEKVFDGENRGRNGRVPDFAEPDHAGGNFTTCGTPAPRHSSFRGRTRSRCRNFLDTHRLPSRWTATATFCRSLTRKPRDLWSRRSPSDRRTFPRIAAVLQHEHAEETTKPVDHSTGFRISGVHTPYSRGGEGGIRTPGAQRPTVFKTAAINRSATSPCLFMVGHGDLARQGALGCALLGQGLSRMTHLTCVRAANRLE